MLQGIGTRPYALGAIGVVAIGDAGGARAQVFDNGPLVTPHSANAGCLPMGAVASEVPSGDTIAGWNASAVSILDGFRVADDFEIPAGTAWTIKGFRFPMYQVAVAGASVNDVRVRIWRGRPGDPGSVPIYGDLETNRFVSGVPADVYRFFYSQCGTLRRIQSVRAEAHATLGPGRYWLEWCAAGTSWSGPWAPPVTIEGLPGKPGADGRHRTWDGWGDAVDEGTRQDFAFVIDGDALCYPDCNRDGVLSGVDFACFQSRFVQADPYADCTADGAFGVADFACFQMAFVSGCP